MPLLPSWWAWGGGRGTPPEISKARREDAAFGVRAKRVLQKDDPHAHQKAQVGVLEKDSQSDQAPF